MSQFGFKNVGHFFATVAGDIVKGARAVGDVLRKVQKAEPEIELLSGLIFPQAVELERGRFRFAGQGRTDRERSRGRRVGEWGQRGA